MQTSNRFANFEALKALGVIFCILYHLAREFEYNTGTNNSHFYSIKFFIALTRQLNGYFIMTSGYFAIKKNTKMSNLFTIAVLYFIYEIIVQTFVWFNKFSTFNLDIILKMFLFNSESDYWYVQAHIASFVILPSIFIGLRTSSKSFYNLLLSMFIYFQFLSASRSASSVLGSWSGGFCIFNFILYALIGGYISLYEISLNKIISISLSISCIILNYLFIAGYGVSLKKYFPRIYFYFSNNNLLNFFSTIGSVFTFLFFQKLSINNKLGEICKFVSSHSLGLLMLQYPFDRNYRIFLYFSFTDFVSKFIPFFPLMVIISTFLLFGFLLIINIIIMYLFNTLIFNRQYYKLTLNYIDSIFRIGIYPDNVRDSVQFSQLQTDVLPEDEDISSS